MLTPEIRDDLDKIVAAGLRQGGVINDITVFNFYAGLRAREKTEEIHSAIFSYLEENGVLVVNDGVEIEGGGER